MIEAYDLAEAATRSSTGTLTVTVNRNLRDPYFVANNYVNEILETQQAYLPFDTVEAADDDTVVCYSLICSSSLKHSYSSIIEGAI